MPKYRMFDFDEGFEANSSNRFTIKIIISGYSHKHLRNRYEEKCLLAFCILSQSADIADRINTLYFNYILLQSEKARNYPLAHNIYH